MIRNSKIKSCQNNLLAEIPAGTEVYLDDPVAETPVLLRLQEMGFVKGALVKLLRSSFMGSPLLVSVRGTQVCLRPQEAALFSCLMK